MKTNHILICFSKDLDGDINNHSNELQVNKNRIWLI